MDVFYDKKIMENDKVIVAISLVMALGLLAGCSGETTVSDDVSVTDSETPGMVVEEKGKADIVGLITKVSANVITVAEIEMPERTEKPVDSGATDETAETEKTVLSFGTGSTGQTGGGAGGAGGGGGDRPEGGPEAGASSGSGQDSMLAELAANSTSKVTVTVPVGISMTMQEEGAVVEMTISDLTTGQMVNIWLNDSVTDKKVAESLSVR